jgi:hypothetical protein
MKFDRSEGLGSVIRDENNYNPGVEITVEYAIGNVPDCPRMGKDGEDIPAIQP